jgi:hypothetical protein
MNTELENALTQLRGDYDRVRLELREVRAERDSLKVELAQIKMLSAWAESNSAGEKFPVIELGVKKLQIGESIFNDLPAVSFLRWHDESNPTINRFAAEGEVEAVITFATTQSLINLKKVLDLLIRRANPGGHEQAAIDSLCLAYGLLWMSEQENSLCNSAWKFLKDGLNREQKKAGIQAAMAAGFEAQVPGAWGEDL